MYMQRGDRRNATLCQAQADELHALHEEQLAANAIENGDFEYADRALRAAASDMRFAEFDRQQVRAADAHNARIQANRRAAAEKKKKEEQAAHLAAELRMLREQRANLARMEELDRAARAREIPRAPQPQPQPRIMPSVISDTGADNVAPLLSNYRSNAGPDIEYECPDLSQGSGVMICLVGLAILGTFLWDLISFIMYWCCIWGATDEHGKQCDGGVFHIRSPTNLHTV